MRGAGLRRRRDSAWQSSRAGRCGGDTRTPCPHPGGGGGCTPGGPSPLPSLRSPPLGPGVAPFPSSSPVFFRPGRSLSVPGTCRSLPGLPSRHSPSDRPPLAEAAAAEHAGAELRGAGLQTPNFFPTGFSLLLAGGGVFTKSLLFRLNWVCSWETAQPPPPSSAWCIQAPWAPGTAGARLERTLNPRERGGGRLFLLTCLKPKSRGWSPCHGKGGNQTVSSLGFSPPNFPCFEWSVGSGERTAGKWAWEPRAGRQGWAAPACTSVSFQCLP